MSRSKGFQRALFEEATRITFTHDDCFTRMHIVSRRENGKHNFYVERNKFLDWLEHGANQYLETDCSHLLRATKYHGIVTMQFYWLSEGYGGQLRGYTQSLCFPYEYLKELMQTARNDAFLSYQGKYGDRLHFDFSSANRTLQSVCADPLKRRALSKALRSRIDCRYGEHVHVYNDFSDSFYLIHTPTSGRAYNGGLVLHHGEKNGRPYVYYGFHT